MVSKPPQSPKSVPSVEPKGFDLSKLKVPPKDNNKPKASVLKSELGCQFCSATFQSERVALKHACKMKRRWMDRHKPEHRQGLAIYQAIWKKSASRNAKPRTHEDFVSSSLYLAVMKFSTYCLEANTIQPMKFVDYLTIEQVRIDDWIIPVHYERYVRWLNEKESPDAAIERNFLLMESWSVNSGEAWTDFFRKINPNLATLWLQSGRISPWVLFAAPSASELLGRLSDEQLEMVNGFIDPTIWAKKLSDNADELYNIKEILTQCGL